VPSSVWFFRTERKLFSHKSFGKSEDHYRGRSKKGSGTVAGTAHRVLRTTVPAPFLNHATTERRSPPRPQSKREMEGEETDFPGISFYYSMPSLWPRWSCGGFSFSQIVSLAHVWDSPNRTVESVVSQICALACRSPSLALRVGMLHTIVGPVVFVRKPLFPLTLCPPKGYPVSVLWRVDRTTILNRRFFAPPGQVTQVE